MTSYRDVLKRIDDPVFAFDELIDLVFVEGQVLVLSQSSFAAIFRGQATLMEQVPKWTTELASHVQISGAGQERLTAKATRDSRARTRLEAIVKRGHLADVGPEQIKSTMRDVGLDPDRLVDVDGNLVLEDDDISMVLQFLNEDLFIGALTNAGFRADRKAPR